MTKDRFDSKPNQRSKPPAGDKGKVVNGSATARPVIPTNKRGTSVAGGGK